MKQNDSPEPVESWEKEFDTRYTDSNTDFRYDGDRENVKYFIRRLLTSQKQKQIEEFVSMLEDLGNDPIKTDPDELPKTEVEVRCFQYGYKTAKDDIITKLRA